MRGFATRLADLGSVESFDYPYQREGRRSPDRQPILVAAHHAAYEAARARHEGPIILIGKSMGGRIGCHVAAEFEPKPKALVCLGYPLVGQSGKVRDSVLLALETPVLFVQGTRDALCPLDQLETVRARMKAESTLHSVDGGDHSLLVTKTLLRARELSQEAVDQSILFAIERFLSHLAE